MQDGMAREVREWRRGLSMAALAASLMLLGCGGGAGGDEAPASGSVEELGTGPDLSSRNYMPAQVGDRWVYEDSAQAGALLTRTIGVRSTARGNGIAVKDSLPDATELIQVRDAEGTWHFPGIDADAFGLAVGPVRVLPSQLRVGQRFVSVDRNLGAVFDFDQDGLADAAALQASTRVVALETLDTAVGRLADCLHLRVSIVYSIASTANRRTVTVTTESNEWYAPGIGLVRLESVTTAPGVPDDTYTQRLVGYRVDDRRTDTVAPAATAPGLPGAQPLGPATVVDIMFSENMDAADLITALRVHDAAGAAVAGTTSVTGPRSMRFVPASAWASGAYSATLSTAALDLLGNALAAEQTWPFIIDATAPVLVGSTPLAGTVDVSLASVIELRFSEPVDPASVNAGTVWAVGGSLLTPLSYEVDGSTVRLRPVAQFIRGASYSIQIAGVTDLRGNLLTSATVNFQADPGRFGPSSPLGEISSDNYVGKIMAGGDLNGDGRADVVAASIRWSGTGWSYEVFRYLQLAGGTLGPATPLALPGNCSIRSMQVADINGDGRQDLVLSASEPCGLMLWRQTPEGELVLDRVLDSSIGLLAVHDMNGDGRLDIGVATGLELRVWLNQAAGWVLHDTLALPARPNQLAVGDINGDGRADFALSSIEQAPAATLVMQSGNGRFAAASLVSSDYNGGSFGVAIGDINGDGRADLVLGDSPGLGVFVQRPDGSLEAFRRVSNAGFLAPVRLADINGDGRIDVLASIAQADLVVWLQQADGSLTEGAVYPGPFRGTNLDADQLAVADVNGDGRPDVLLNGHVFRQRSVPVMSQSVKPVRRAR